MTKNDFICQYVMRLSITEREKKKKYPDPDWLIAQAMLLANKLEDKNLFTKLK